MDNIGLKISTGFGELVKPRLITDEEAAEIAHQDRLRDFRRKLNLAGIPDRYRSARLDDCRPEVVAYHRSLLCSKRGPWMVLVGPNGTGKTHQACALAMAQMWEHPAWSVRFATMGGIMNRVYDTFSGRDSTEAAIRTYTDCRLLVIDDFGKERPSSPQQAARFFDVVNRRYDNRKPTVFTTNLNSKELLEALVVDGDRHSAQAILDRMSGKENTFVRFEGRSLRR